MSALKQLRKVRKTVISILEQNEKARNSDSLLYLEVLQAVDKDLLNMPVGEFLSHMSELNAPPFETVRRTRQRAQAENPSLSACPKVAEYREANEIEYRQFARGM